MEIGTVRLVNIENEMRGSYIDYAMSVIMSRALPDVRDGLKPVQRRIIYAMDEIGLRSDVGYRKSATVVGEVLGKYHPHGDAPVYETMVRMAQDFSMRYPLIDGQGNFGSIDDDPPAAMRYCVTGDTLVVVDSGLRRIDSLSTTEDVALRVLSANGKVNSASKWFDSGVHPTRRIRTQRGYEVTGTENHPLLVCVKGPDGAPALVWKLAGDIEVGDFLVIDRTSALWPETEVDLRPFQPTLAPGSRTERHTLPETLSPEFALLLGALVAEGTCRDTVIEFTNTPADFADTFRSTWSSVFPICRLHEFVREPVGDGKKPFFQFQVVSRQVIPFLKALGLNGKSATRTVPDVILQSPKAVVAAFLRGLFEGDGSVEQSGRSLLRINLTSKSRAMLRQVQTLLLRFGILSTLNIDAAHDMYRLLIVGKDAIEAFAQEIGFVSATKRAALANVHSLHTGKALSRTEFVPYVADYVRANAGRGQREWLPKHNIDRPGRLVAALPRLATCLPLAAVANPEHLARTNYHFERVTSVEDAGLQQVYSIRVDSDCHSFVANGFVNHNTEARMAAITNELLADIDKNTVDMVDNFDGRHLQPTVLPARFPNLLVNGATGIAVGMATNIPPHNLSEICDATNYLIDHPDATVDDLMKYVKGPDFPTRGILLSADGIRAAYTTGRGRVVIRAKTHIEESRNGRYQIVVTEIPYMVNKSAVISRIADLVKEKKIENISELRDESDRQGIRIIIEVGRGGNPRALLNNLYKHTQLQTAFSINMLALVDNQPRVMTLKSVLQNYLTHRIDVITRRTQFDLDKARARAHILEGLKIALDNLDAVIQTIRSSESVEIARNALMSRFSLSELQAQAILDMQLRRLAALERQKILDELAALLKEIAYYEDLLAHPEKMYGLIKDDLADVKKRFGDARRTVISAEENGDFTVEDLIPQQQVVITISQRGYIKRLPADTYRTQNRGGRGKVGMVTREADAVQHLMVANTHDSVLFFTNRGRVYHLKAHEIPELSRQGKGVPLINIANVEPEEFATGLIVVANFNAAECLLFVTRKGEVKRVKLSDFASVRPSGLIAMDIENGDELVWVKMTNSSQDAILIAQNGKAARFSVEDVRLSNRGSGGVRGIKLIGSDKLVGAEIVENGADLVMVTENGYGKRTRLSNFPSKGRGTQGVIALGINAKTGRLAATSVVTPDDELMIISQDGIVIRMPLSNVSQLGRPAQGVTMMRLGDNDRVVSAARVKIEEPESTAEAKPKKS